MTGSEPVLRVKKTERPSARAVSILTAVLSVLLSLIVAHHAAAAFAVSFMLPDGSGLAAGKEAADVSTADESANASVRISELMAYNEATLADGDGQFPDWVELCNMSNGPVQMEGWTLR